MGDFFDLGIGGTSTVSCVYSKDHGYFAQKVIKPID